MCLMCSYDAHDQDSQVQSKLSRKELPNLDAKTIETTTKNGEIKSRKEKEAATFKR